MIENIKILLVEDDKNLGSILKDFLSLKGYNVQLAEDGEKGFSLFHTNSFDIGILDVMMPKKDGFTLAEEIRKHNSSFPIIFLTAKYMLDDKITGLKIADDYLTKPFSTEELLLRIENVLKRTSHAHSGLKEINCFIGKYQFDSNKRKLNLKGKSQKLTSKESALLQLLANNINSIVKRETALKLIWGDDSYFNSRSMDVYIARLRKCFKEDPSIQIINVHGTGYKLIT